MPLSYAMSGDVSHHVSGGVLRVSVDRAEKRNPLSLGALQQINEIFTEKADDHDLRLAIVTGAGDQAFASGGDLVELADMRSIENARSLTLHGKAALNAIRRFPVPVVARVNGIALGGGAELALACDMRFAASNAAIGFIHSRLAISPSWGGGVDLMRLVGYSTGTRLLARGEILPAPKALAFGLFDEVAPDGVPFDKSFADYIAGMVGQSPHVMRAVKALAVEERLNDLDRRQHVESEHFVKTWTDAAHWAAVAAMAERPNRAKGSGK